MNKNPIGGIIPLNKYKHVLKIMKATLFFLFFSILFSQAANSFSQETEFTLHLKSTTIKEVCKELERKSDYRFVFAGNANKEANKRVNVNAESQDIEEILDDLLSDTKLAYRILDNQVVVYLDKDKNSDEATREAVQEQIEEQVAQQQKKQITGKIVDVKGEPVIGANIIETGTTNGTVTDANGNFSLQVKNDATIRVSYIGYLDQNINTTDRTSFDIVLKEDTRALDELVVTALGIKREAKALGYSVTKVGEQEFAKIREVNFMNSLVGKVAGLDIGGNISNPAGSTRITLRGNTSIAGDNQPLFIINGIPMNNSKLGESGESGQIPNWGDNISSLNSEDIEEITVLKGATAAALYGSRAKNGAILITTKSGRDRKGFGVEFTTHNTWEVPYFLWDEIMQKEYGVGMGGVRPYTAAFAARYNQRHWGEKLDGKMTMHYDGKEHPYSYQNDKLLDDFYSTGFSTSNTVAFSNSNESGSFRLGITEMRTDGIVQNFNMKRRNISLSTTQKIFEALEFAANVEYINEDVKNRYFRNTQGGIPQTILMIANSMGPEELSPGYDENLNETGVGTDGNATNPYFVLNRFRNVSDKDRFITAVTAKWDILSWLYLRAKVGQDYFTFKTENIIPDGTAFYKEGRVEQSERKFFERNYELLLGLDKNLSDDLSFNLNVGGNLMSQKGFVTSITGLGLNIPHFLNINNTKQRSSGSSVSERKTNSVFGVAELGFRDWLFVNVTGRNDWYSTLNPASNSYFYPSIGGSFIFTELFDLPDFFSFGKLRSSYATVGGDTSPYQLHLTYGVSGEESSFNGRPFGYIAQSTVPNINIRPLRVDEFEVGGDFKFFDNRLGLDIAYYNKLTSDDITTESISTTSGYSGNLVNVGQVRNKGFEFLLYGTPVSLKDFSWDISLNGTFSESKVLKISDQVSELTLYREAGAVFKQVEGKPYSFITGRTTLKNDKGEEILDAQGLPQLAPDLVDFGSGIHRFMAGINNNLSYKNFLLSFSIDGKFGAKIFSRTHNQLYHRGLLKSTLPGREDGIVLPGVNAEGQPNTVRIPAQQVSTRAIVQRRRDAVDDFLFDASFIKLRNVSLTYTLPQSVLQSVKFIQGATISLVGRNLATLMRHTPGIDPETNALSGNIQGLEDNSLPPVRNIGVNINVKF